MKWLDNWFYKLSRRAWEMNNTPNVVTEAPINAVKSNYIESNGISMNLYVGNGGYVVEFRNYDSYKDRYNNKMYIISDTENLGGRMSEIIVQHILQNS